MFTISGQQVFSYSYNEEKEQLTFYDACGRSVCDVSMSAEQYAEEIESMWDTAQDRMEALGEIFGDAEQKRFIVLLDRNYVRDMEIFHGSFEDSDENQDSAVSYLWRPGFADISLGTYTADDAETARHTAANEHNVLFMATYALQLADNNT